MQEEFKEIENSEKTENKKKGLIIFVIVFAILLLSVGGVLVYKSMNDGKSEKETTDNKETVENNSSEQAAVSLDEHLKDFKFDLTEESRLELIDSTSNVEYSDERYHGAMFNDVISNEYKTIYTISEATWKFLNKNYDFYVSNMGKKIKIRKSTIEYLAKQLFVDYSMPESLEETWYAGIFDLACDSEECLYSYTTFGLTGAFSDGYLFKPEFNGNVITVKPIYAIMDQYIDMTDNGVVGDFSLYKDHNKELVKSFTNYEILQTNEVYSRYTQDVYDLWVKEYSSLPTYKYTFTEDHKLISVEKK